MSPKQQRGEETARRLVTAALQVFERDGQDGFTVHSVCAASGVSLGSLYHHFGSFDGLAAAVYARCMADLLDTMIAALERSRTARGGVRAAVVAYLRFAAEQPAKARFIHASAYSAFLPAHAATVAAVKDPRMERIAAWLRPHAAAGRIARLPDPLTEMLVIGPAAETARRWLAGVPGIDLDVAIRWLPERVWHSLRPEA